MEIDYARTAGRSFRKSTSSQPSVSRERSEEKLGEGGLEFAGVKLLLAINGYRLNIHVSDFEPTSSLVGIVRIFSTICAGCARAARTIFSP